MKITIWVESNDLEKLYQFLVHGIETKIHYRTYPTPSRIFIEVQISYSDYVRLQDL